MLSKTLSNSLQRNKIVFIYAIFAAVLGLSLYYSQTSTVKINQKKPEISGTLRHITQHVLDQENPIEQAVLVTEGKTYTLDYGDNLEEYYNKYITVQGDINQNTLIAQKIELSTNASLTDIDSSEAQSTTGDIKPLVLLINFKDNTSTPFSKELLAQNIFTGENSVKNYFTEASFGKTKIIGDINSVKGWYTIDLASDKCDTNWLYDMGIKARAKAEADGISYSNYNSFIIIHARTAACSTKLDGKTYPIEGLSELGGRLVWMNGNANIRPIAHEIVHTMGIGHSHLCTDISCQTIRETGDRTDLMGIYQNTAPSHINAAFKNALKWIPETEPRTKRLLGPKKYDNLAIYPVEESSSNTQLIKIGILPPYYSADYTITYRVKKDNNFDARANIENGIYIHRYSTLESTFGKQSPSSKLVRHLTPGNPTFTDPEYKVTIKLIGMDSTKANLFIDYGLDGTFVNEPAPSPSGTAPSISYCSGLDAKNMLSNAVTYCYGHAKSTTCATMDTALRASYGPANLCEQNKTQCTSGASSGICTAAAEFQKVTDWCYNIVRNDPTEAGKAGVSAKWCNDFATVTSDAHEDCNTCSGGTGSNPEATPKIVAINGGIWDTNGNPVSGVKVKVEGNGASGAWKPYFPTTRPNGTFSQGGFIVKGGRYNVSVVDVEAKTIVEPDTKNRVTGQDTPLGSVAYLNQQAESDDCTESWGGADSRCIFLVRKPLDIGTANDVTTFYYPSNDRIVVHRSYVMKDGRTFNWRKCSFPPAKGWPVYCEGYNKTMLDTPTPILGYGALMISSKVRQDFIASNGQTRYSRVCAWNKEKSQVTTCGAYVTEKITAPTAVRDINTMILFGKYRESLISLDGKKTYSRDCTLDFSTTAFSNCTAYQTYSTQTILSGGVSGYGALPYRDGYGRTAIQQIFLGMDGRTFQVGSCVAQSSSNITCKNVF